MWEEVIAKMSWDMVADLEWAFNLGLLSLQIMFVVECLSNMITEANGILFCNKTFLEIAFHNYISASLEDNVCVIATSHGSTLLKFLYLQPLLCSSHCASVSLCPSHSCGSVISLLSNGNGLLNGLLIDFQT